MKAGPIEIGRLLQNRQRFCVPIYQRHYVWSREKQWEPFWNDIRTKAIECLSGRERRFSHFMGAVVLETRGGFSAGRVPAFQVVDGQQRLTTFQIFLAAARDCAISLGFNDSAERISDYLLNDKPHLMEDPEVEVFKVWPTQYDRSLFIDIISTGREALRKKYMQHFYAKRDKIYDYSSVPNLLSGYGYFFDQIKNAIETDDLDDELTISSFNESRDDEIRETQINDLASKEIKFDAIWQALVEEFKVVEIVLEDGDDAQVIFETLNERGQPLLAADLIRNNIFHRADACGEKADNLFSRHWKPFEDRFWSVDEKQGRYKKPRIEFFLANFIAGKISGEVNIGKLFSEYKAYLKPLKGSSTSRYSTVEDEVKELVAYGKIYREMIERTADSNLARFSRKLQPWDVTTVYPLVLRTWTCKELDEEGKSFFLKILLSFIVRRAICGLTSKNYNKLFLALISSLDEKGWKKEVFIKLLLDQKSESGRFPRDEEFKLKWLNSKSYKDLQAGKCRAVLEEIEKVKRSRFHETNQLTSSLTVEHLMPRNWSNSWPLADGTTPTNGQFIDALYISKEDDSTIGQIVRRNRLLESFGNLTLLTQSLNSSISNGPFGAKRSALNEHSLLVLNREITQYDDWDEDSISARGESLFCFAKDLWPIPEYINETFENNQK